MRQHLAGAVLGATLAGAVCGAGHLVPRDTVPSAAVLASLEAAEGWRGACYDDSRGYGTIAFGTRLPLTKAEGALLLRERARANAEELAKRWPPMKTQPARVRDALVEMAYQLGAGGVLEFRRMLEALERGDRAAAAAEALRSEWARAQTPARAARVAALLRGG